ncbi:response regulator [Arenimonas sp.]|nr:response regulator [Candidatus Parcubacteria bacterium]
MNNLHSKTIMVVDDEPSLRHALMEKISHENFSVLEAANGSVALESALKKHPDLILLDIDMPVMNGIEMLKKLREDPWGKTVRVIILTNSMNSVDLLKVLETETFDYFVKADIVMEDLIKKIKVYLN